MFKEELMNRRHFMAHCTGMVVGPMGESLLEHNSLLGQSASDRARIGVSTWSFHNLFASTPDDNAPVPAKNLDMLDFPEMIADRYQAQLRNQRGDMSLLWSSVPLLGSVIYRH
jgi:hypothetical protein